MTTALVLTGGGARGAYQAGALVELLPALAAQGRRPTVLCGASVGALNAAAVAATAHLPVEDQVGALVAAWGRLRERDVLRPFVGQVPRLVVRYLTELSPFSGPRLRGLIDSAALRETLERWMDWEQLDANTAPGGPIDTLMATTTEVATGAVRAFVAGELPEGNDARVAYTGTALRAEHLVASAAIPLLFEATHVAEPAATAGWYSDGSTRLARPITQAVDAGADDVVVVSTTSLVHAQRRPDAVEQEPDLADVAVNVLEALVQEVLIDDLERCHDRVRSVVVAPEDPEALARLAREAIDDHHRGPFSVLRSDIPLIDWALGGRSPRQAELLSNLLFDPSFMASSMELGARDARRALYGES